MEITYTSTGLLNSLSAVWCSFCGAVVLKAKQDLHTQFHQYPDGQRPKEQL